MKCGIMRPNPGKLACSMPTEHPHGQNPRHVLHMPATGVEDGRGEKKPGPALTDPGQGGH
jgi:hypothetical protein